MGQTGGFQPFPICPTCDTHALKAVIADLKPRHPIQQLSAAVGRSNGRGISSFLGVCCAWITAHMPFPWGIMPHTWVLDYVRLTSADEMIG